jgi:hypothetical protein
MGNSPGSRRASREDSEEFAEVLPGPRRAVSERVPPPLSEIKEVMQRNPVYPGVGVRVYLRRPTTMFTYCLSLFMIPAAL